MSLKKQLLDSGPWKEIYTRDAFLWQVHTSSGKLVTGSSNRAAQDLNPSATLPLVLLLVPDLDLVIYRNGSRTVNRFTTKN